MRLGALTIGQSPRDDVTPEFLEVLGCGSKAVELVQAGALDGLSLAEIRELAPAADCPSVLVTRLRDGTEVRLDESKILDLLQDGIGRLESEGVSAIALFCTGEFPGFRTGVPILRPDRLLAHFVQSVAPEGSRICAIVPSPLQIGAMEAKWEGHGMAVEAVPLSPYTSGREEVEAVAARVAAREPDYVILDCIGYTGAVKETFLRACRCPVILPRSLLGRAAAELSIS